MEKQTEGSFGLEKRAVRRVIESVCVTNRRRAVLTCDLCNVCISARGLHKVFVVVASLSPPPSESCTALRESCLSLTRHSHRNHSALYQ